MTEVRAKMRVKIGFDSGRDAVLYLSEEETEASVTAMERKESRPLDDLNGVAHIVNFSKVEYVRISGIEG